MSELASLHQYSCTCTLRHSGESSQIQHQWAVHKLNLFPPLSYSGLRISGNHLNIKERPVLNPEQTTAEISPLFSEQRLLSMSKVQGNYLCAQRLANQTPGMGSHPQNSPN